MSSRSTSYAVHYCLLFPIREEAGTCFLSFISSLDCLLPKLNLMTKWRGKWTNHSESEPGAQTRQLFWEVALHSKAQSAFEEVKRLACDFLPTSKATKPQIGTAGNCLLGWPNQAICIFSWYEKSNTTSQDNPYWRENPWTFKGGGLKINIIPSWYTSACQLWMGFRSLNFLKKWRFLFTPKYYKNSINLKKFLD